MDLIETERLILKKYNLNDAQILFDSVQKNIEHLSEILVQPVRELKNIDDTVKLINMINQFWENDEKFIIPLWLKGNGLLVGECYLGNFNSDKTEAEIGYFLFKEFEGNGFAYEATRGLIKEAFEKLNLKRIWLKCDSDNLRSIKLALKCEFIRKKDETSIYRVKSNQTKAEILTFFLDNNYQ